MLKIKELEVKIRTKTLLEGIELDLKEGMLNIIIGPNGAGKSTLLKTIAGILKSSNGSIFLDNLILNELNIDELSKHIAYMGQFNQNSNLSVIDILELSRRKYSGLNLTQKDYLLIEKSVKEFNLELFLNRNIDELSGGERQKIFLCAAIIQEPKILLLDEPISQLDPKNQIEMLELIKKKTVEYNFITVTVLHDLQNTLHYANKIVMIKKGRVINFQAPLDVTEEMIYKLYETPCKLFWQEGHPFCFFGHKHTKFDSEVHTHKKEKSDI